jgi:hypothetical protein
LTNQKNKNTVDWSHSNTCLYWQSNFMWLLCMHSVRCLFIFVRFRIDFYWVHDMAIISSYGNCVQILKLSKQMTCRVIVRTYEMMYNMQVQSTRMLHIDIDHCCTPLSVNVRKMSSASMMTLIERIQWSFVIEYIYDNIYD